MCKNEQRNEAQPKFTGSYKKACIAMKEFQFSVNRFTLWLDRVKFAASGFTMYFPAKELFAMSCFTVQWKSFSLQWEISVFCQPFYFAVKEFLLAVKSFTLPWLIFTLQLSWSIFTFVMRNFVLPWAVFARPWINFTLPWTDLVCRA